MAELYPEIEPYDHGMLDVGDRNHVYWEVCGNPDGKPAVVLHGRRLVTHYWPHAAWLEDGILLREAGRLPGVLVHGRLDVSGPLDIVWELARAWPDSQLVVLDEAGTSSRDPGTTETLVAATDRFASCP